MMTFSTIKKDASFCMVRLSIRLGMESSEVNLEAARHRIVLILSLF